MKNITKILWGIILIVIGLVIGINSLGIANIDLFFDGWWTLFIIVPSFIGLFNDDDKSGAFVGLAIGLILLLAAQGIISYKLIAKLIVPTILVTIGVTIISNEIFGKKVKEKVSAAESSDLETLAAILKEEIRSFDNAFTGAQVDAVFGHAVLDIRKVKIENEAVIKASAIFGGIDILVPKDTIVKVKSTKVLGGVNKTSIDANTKKEKIIYIEAFSMFGGIDIK